MLHHHSHFPRNRGTFGETLLAIIALLGLVVPFAMGYQLSEGDIGLYIAFLGVIVIFYFAILLCRAIFIFMTGKETFWWEHYAEEQKLQTKKR